MRTDEWGGVRKRTRRWKKVRSEEGNDNDILYYDNNIKYYVSVFYTCFHTDCFGVEWKETM